MSTEILIIDDNPDIRNILKDLISDAVLATSSLSAPIILIFVCFSNY